MPPELELSLPTGKYYTIAGLQEVLGLCRGSVRKLLQAGLLDARKLGNLTVVPDELLRGFLTNLPSANLAMNDNLQEK